MTAQQILSQATVEEHPEAPASQAKPSLRPRIVAAARRILLVLVVLAVGYAVVSEWDTVSTTLRKLSWGTLSLAETALIAGMLVSTRGWQIVLDDLGPAVGFRRGSQISLVGSLGKYLPGSVWAYVLQMELGRKAGVQRARILTATIVQVAVSVVASLLLGTLALPLVLRHSPQAAWLFILLPFGLAGLHPRALTWLVNRGMRMLKKPGLERPLTFATVGKTLACASVSYGFFGVHLWLLAQSQGNMGFKGVLLCIGAISMGLTAGLFAFILPSGVGVREVVVAAALSSVMAPAQAVAFAVASRLLFTVADLLTAGGAALSATRIRKIGSPSVAVD